jgi:hypothetical protein
MSMSEFKRTGRFIIKIPSFKARGWGNLNAKKGQRISRKQSTVIVSNEPRTNPRLDKQKKSQFLLKRKPKGTVNKSTRINFRTEQLKKGL